MQSFQAFEELALSYAKLYSLSFDADEASLEYLKLYPHLLLLFHLSELALELYSWAPLFNS